MGRSRVPLPEGGRLGGHIATDESDFAAARQHHESALAIARDNGWEIDVATSELNLALATMRAGELHEARTMLTRVMAYHREHATDEGIGFAALNLGDVAYRLNDVDAMEQHFTEAFAAFTRIGFDANAAHALQGLAAAQLMAGAADRAANLLGRASRVLSRTGEVDATFEKVAADTESAARAVVGDAVFDEEFDRGRAESRPDPQPAD